MVERKMGESPNDLVIITGMSGAGRTEAMHAFEDLGYFCIDNLPASLLGQLLVVTADDANGLSRKLAVVCDARNKDYFADLDDELDALHRRVRKLADRVHELETRESVNSLVTDTNAIVLRRLM